MRLASGTSIAARSSAVSMRKQLRSRTSSTTSARIRAPRTCRQSSGCSSPMYGAVRASMRSPRRCIGQTAGILLLLACAPGPGASSSADPGRSFAPSGFLGDYAELRRGTGSEARLVYLDSAQDFSGYTHVIIEPVVVWRSDEARFAGVPQAQRESLAGGWEAELRR